MQATVRYIHRISPRPTDYDGPHHISSEDLSSLDKARAWVKRATGSKPPAKNARKTEDGGWVFFPADKPGNWHSISIVLLTADKSKRPFDWPLPLPDGWTWPAGARSPVRRDGVHFTYRRKEWCGKERWTANSEDGIPITTRLLGVTSMRDWLEFMQYVDQRYPCPE